MKQGKYRIFKRFGTWYLVAPNGSKWVPYGGWKNCMALLQHFVRLHSRRKSK